ncbi:hypothetical protein F511_13512 [Dorcoceras hygrometricum]|uniref:Uncharacterized protein n=1 Tax=Dorcoceras hygrometricum TaxID=472368 RepID=A0A2Z7BB81_9LAMI|nr:hypothetical protein F511_13512 [Dorcoceras hygrometricum]
MIGQTRESHLMLIIKPETDKYLQWFSIDKKISGHYEFRLDIPSAEERKVLPKLLRDTQNQNIS